MDGISTRRSVLDGELGGGELTGSDSMVVHPPQLRLKAWSSSTAGAKEDCIFCLFVEGSNADIGGSWSAPEVLGIWGQKRAQLTREEDGRSRVDATFFLCRMMMVMIMVMMMVMVPTCILLYLLFTTCIYIQTHLIGVTRRHLWRCRALLTDLHVCCQQREAP